MHHTYTVEPARSSDPFINFNVLRDGRIVGAYTHEDTADFRCKELKDIQRDFNSISTRLVTPSLLDIFLKLFR